MKNLVVYYSRSGNTKKVAETMARELKADLQQLVDKRGRSGLFGFLRAGRDAMKKRTTELQPLNLNPKDYDLILVGTPVWASNPAPAVRAFLHSHDLSGKKVALVCTMSARGGEEALAGMRNLLTGAEVVAQLDIAMKKETESQIEEKVVQWTAQWKDQG